MALVGSCSGIQASRSAPQVNTKKLQLPCTSSLPRKPISRKFHRPDLLVSSQSVSKNMACSRCEVREGVQRVGQYLKRPSIWCYSSTEDVAARTSKTMQIHDGQEIHGIVGGSEIWESRVVCHDEHGGKD